MRILVVAPQQKPIVKEVEHTLTALQEVVGGPIQVLCPFREPVVLVCNEEGKVFKLPMNRALRDEDGQMYDVICGTFFLCGLSGDSFASLTEELIQKFKMEFAVPERFIRIGNYLIVLPIGDGDI